MAAALYMAEAAITGSPSLPGPPALGYLGAGVCGVLSARCMNAAFRGQRTAPRRPAPERAPRGLLSWVGAIFDALGQFGELLALVAGLFWLVQYVLGRAAAPDELQHDGLVLLAVIAAVVVGALINGSVGRRGRRSADGGRPGPRRGSDGPARRSPT